MPEPASPEPSAKADEAARRDRTSLNAQTVRLARKTQSLDILYEVATSLSQPGGIERLLEGFLDTLIELVDARGGSVRLVTDDRQTRLVASRGLDPEVVEADRLMPGGRCPCGLAAAEGGVHIQKIGRAHV